MKFENIYSETEENMRLALLSLWATGNHPLRPAIKDLLDRESLLAEPVFQSTFGWEPSSDESWRGAINTEVWENLEELRRKQAKKANKDFRPFHPFKHQAESWNTLKDNKSIVVTSGTGSGKTECFMYPVLSDLYEQKNNKAIKAIFLYPLNALMEDQKKRLSEYCETLGLKYAVYNGDTPDRRDEETEGADEETEGAELTTREQIRTKLPDILLTNPSMLEYILVRKADQQMLQKSAGKLRWIIIDEAHSYSGSAAVELAYQIKRILDGFGTEAGNIRFACTSATIGGEEGAQSLAEFISTLTGQPIEQIKVIGGNRLVPDLDETALKQQLPVDHQRVISLRNQINNVAGMTLQQLWEWLCPNQDFKIIPALRLVDTLCEMQQEGKAVLSLRAHFFMRSINGLYACANENCEGKNHAIPLYGHLTTHKSSVCPKCGAPLLELVQCKPCSSFVLMGSSNDDTHKVYPCEEGFNTDDYFALNASDDDEEDEEETTGNRETFFLLPYDSTNFVKPTSIQETEVVYRKFEHDIKGTTLLDCDEENGKWVQIMHTEKRNSYCPNCGKLAEGKKLYFKRFRIPISFINQAIAPVLLRECATNGYWGKYIAFTDSRQGTAISAKTFNINAERLHSYKGLIKTFVNNREREWNRLPEYIKKLLESDPQEKEKHLNQLASTIPFKDASEAIFSQDLFEHFSENESHRSDYPKALLRNTIGRRPLYESNAESMGLIYLDYPTLSNVIAPKIKDQDETNLTLNDSDWRDYLKIVIDYFLRYRNHLQPLVESEKNFIRESNQSKCIQGPQGEENWMSGVGGDISRNRIVVLLCAGLGIDTQEKFEKNKKNIDKLLKQAWDDLKGCKILISPNNDGMYYVDLSANSTICNIKRLEKAWVCPVTRRLLDTTFCGYSPMLKGRICKEWFKKYKCKEEDILTMPCRPTNNNEVTQWMETDCSVQTMKNRGFWTDRHKYAYHDTPPFIAAEHSAQQSKERLQDYTKKFTKNPPEVNVLHCSTTMEMGVDIGDIEIVLMDTIPPTAANYLQRVGRAGRMGQSKALAFSLCNNTPVGQYAFEHPMWALQTVNHMAKVLSSQTIIQRHVNSYFFRQFICREQVCGEQGEGMSVKVSVEDFITNRCNTFIDFLDSISTDTKAQARFAKVFGMDVPYAVDNTKKAIEALQEEYTQSISKLRNAITQFGDNDRRCLAISHQIRKTENENLLKYLSEHQFIPNANMPTGIVTFDFKDKGDCGELNRLQGKLDRQYNLLEQNPERRDIQQEINKLKKDIKNLHKATTAARDIRTALNEYAPGQTVVVNEKNYKSAGLAMYGAYNTETQIRALYHCGHCGHTEYINILDENLTCSVCKNNYHSIIDRNHSRFSLAYEPVGFCIDHNEDGTREEKTEKNYYDIRPLLLETDWREPVQVNMCDVISSGETGRILFCNLGKGHGFAFCKHCGRVDLEYAQSTNDDNIPSGVKKGHQHLWYSDNRNKRTCDAKKSDIARHVVFTGFHPTCYSALRFKKNAGCNEYEKDERLVYSLGVVLKRALVKILGIDEGEVDFGVKEEREAYILFIYDTAKGGCGYSLRLCNAAFCQEVFDEARKSLEQANCNCHKEDGACTHCLVERNNYRFAHLLSKELALNWLNKQSDNVPQLSQEVLAYSPHAQIVFQNLKEIVKQAVKDSNTKTLSLFVSDVTDDYILSDWSDIRQEMGRLISTAVQKGKTVNLYVEYHPQFHTEALDKYPFIDLSDKFSSCNVSLIKDMGVYKTAIMVEDYSGGIRRYFTDLKSTLSFSQNWGSECNYAYTDTIRINPAKEQEPTFELPSNCIIREGVTRVTSFQVKDYFSEAIAPYVLEPEDLDALYNILHGKQVDITFSDMYVNSALASLMLVYLIDNMKKLFKFDIGSVTLQLDSPKRKCNNDRFNDYTYISFNFENKEDADEYTDQLFEDVLGVTPKHSNDDADHHRWMKLSTSDGGMVEIRPDHGISGGYKSSSQYINLETLSGSVCAIKQNEAILYYVIYKNGNA